MPWTDKPGGQGGGRGPWGQPPNQGANNNGNGQRPPDLEDLLRSGRDRFRKMGGEGGGNGRGPSLDGLPKGPILLIGLAAIAFIVFSLVSYQVQPQQIAVVTTFGNYSKLEGPGLRFLLPGVQSKELVDVGQDRSEEFGGQQSEGAMLTKDLNIAQVTFSVNWKVQAGGGTGATTNKDDPSSWPGAAKYALVIEEPEVLLRSVAEAAVREVVGANEFDPLITNGRTIVPAATQQIMQEALDRYNSGIEILSVNYDKAQPPQEVIANQLDVIDARSQKQEKINTAQAYANRIVPEARGQAEKKLLDAESYSAEKIAEARGAAARFNDIYAEYRKNPDVTRQRMYLETMEKVLGDKKKILLDDTGGSGPVPYLNLNELNRSATRQGE